MTSSPRYSWTVAFFAPLFALAFTPALIGRLLIFLLDMLEILALRPTGPRSAPSFRHACDAAPSPVHAGRETQKHRGPETQPPSPPLPATSAASRPRRSTAQRAAPPAASAKETNAPASARPCAQRCSSSPASQGRSPSVPHSPRPPASRPSHRPSDAA